MAKSFFGGIHPKENKHYAENAPVQEYREPDVLVIPVALVYIVNAKLFTSLVPDFLSAIDLFSRYSGFSYGHFDIAATVFYLSFVGFFLFLTVRSMEKRRLM